nr:MAG TPA: hypothetical protein [Caudoviricetes sp.]
MSKKFFHKINLLQNYCTTFFRSTQYFFGKNKKIT